MANEVTVTATLTVDNGNIQMDKSITKSVTMTGNVVQNGVQEIGTSDEQVTIVADVGTYGYILVRNLDSSNYIELATTDSSPQYLVKLKAGEIALFRCGANALYGKANTAACDLEYWLVED